MGSVLSPHGTASSMTTGDLSLRALAAPSQAVVGRVLRDAPLVASESIGFWWAYYDALIVQNGWEPFDQPTPATYMPRGYTSFEAQHLGNGCVLLLERRARSCSSAPRLSHPGMRGTAESGAPDELALIVDEILTTFAIAAEDRAAFVAKMKKQMAALSLMTSLD